MIRSTFAIPAIIAALTLAGLVLALTGDGAPDMLAWIALALPPIALVWAWTRPTSSKSKTQKGK